MQFPDVAVHMKGSAYLIVHIGLKVHNPTLKLHWLREILIEKIEKTFKSNLMEMR